MDYGIHYWRPNPRIDCPIIPFPVIQPNNHDVPPVELKSPTKLYVYVDLECPGGVNTRKSVTCLALMLAGGPLHKIRSQPTISHSTTDAEFVAATECANTAL